MDEKRALTSIDVNVSCWLHEPVPHSGESFMIRVLFNIVIVQPGKPDHCIENHLVTFTSVGALLEAMVTLLALGSGLSTTNPMAEEVITRCRANFLLDPIMIPDGMQAGTRIFIQKYRLHKEKMPDWLSNPDLGSDALVLAAAASPNPGRIIALERDSH